MSRYVAWSLLLFALPSQAGTYGSFTVPRTGFTVAEDINVGSMSPESHEDEVLRSRQAELKAKLTPLFPIYDAFYRRAVAGEHPYRDWLGALDTTRATAQQWDYKSRLPGPLPRPAAPTPGPQTETSTFAQAPEDGDRAPQLYLHMRADSSGVERGRALVGFTLAQIALGDSKQFVLPSLAKSPLADRLDRAAHGDSFTGQAVLLAALLLDVRKQAADLDRIAEIGPAAPELRLLAGLLVRALRHELLTAADWQRVDDAKGKLERRTLWTWMLVLCSDKDAVARTVELRKHAPLSAADAASWKAELDGKSAK